MKVEMLTREYPPEIYGGAGVHVAELVKNLRQLIQVNVRAFGQMRDEPATFGYQTPTFLQAANPSLQTIGVDLSMTGDISDADLVHSHTWYTNFAGHLTSLLHGIPHVITAHSLEPLRPWKADALGGGYQVSSWIEKSSYEAASKIIAVSAAMKRDIIKSYPDLDHKKIEVIHNGIDAEIFRPKENPQALVDLGIDPGARSVVFVGRMTRQKGLTYLLKAAKELPTDVELILAASSPDNPIIEAEITDLIQELKSHRSGVILLNQQLSREQLVNLLTHASIFACPSIYEPLGIVNLEAMACETPVVATATGGIPEVVQDGVTGKLVPIEQLQDGSGTPLDESKFVSDFAKALNELLAEKDLESYQKASRKTAVDNFSWSRIAKDTVKVYQSLLN